jgi:hypothetical protein
MATDNNGAEVADQVCQKVADALNMAGSATDNANTLQKYVQLIDEGAGQALKSVIEDVGGGALSMLSAAQCGCEWYHGLGQLGNFLGSCIKDVLCALDEVVFDNHCHCIPQPPVQADCSQWISDHCLFADAAKNDPACAPQNFLVYAADSGQDIILKTTPAGTLAVVPGSGAGPDGKCASDMFCFCPAPMVPGGHDYGQIAGNVSVFTCSCPPGTHAVAGLKTTVCLCDDTKLPMQGPDALFSACPGPSFGCGTGLTYLNGKCVAECSDPTMGRTADGTCCDPAQMTSCGTCCPPGLIPDPNTGGCIAPPPLPGPK